MPAAGGLTSMHNGVIRGRIAAWGVEPHAATSTHGSSATICPSTTDALSLSALRSKITDVRDSYLPRRVTIANRDALLGLGSRIRFDVREM